MTNSYSSSLKKLPRLLILHGLNNNPQAFVPLVKHFQAKGLDVRFVTLPCHGENRREARNFKEAFACFDRSMKELTQEPYVALAFSHGALYLQLWQEKEPSRRPLSQVLLAPALHIQRHAVLARLMGILPSFFLIKSFSPARFRRYQGLTVWEYRILLHGIRALHKIASPFKVPTLVLVDPKDELVDVQKLQEMEGATLELWPREYLTKGIGRHHILFHPDYFTAEAWTQFIERIENFFRDKTA